MEQRRRVRVLPWIVAVALVCTILYWLGFENTGKALSEANAPRLGAAIGIYLLCTGVRLWKWSIMLAPAFSMREVALMFCSSKALGGILPGRVGELAPLLRTEFRTPQVAAAIAVDRLLEIMGTTLVAVLGCQLFSIWSGRIVYFLLAFAVAAIAVLFQLLLRPGLWKACAAFTSQWPRISRYARLLPDISQASLDFGAKYYLLSVLSVLASAADILFCQCLLWSVGAVVSWSLLAVLNFLYCAIALLSITPGGIGISDLVVLYLLNSVPPGQRGAYYVIVNAIARIMPWVFLGVAWVFWNRTIDKARSDGGPPDARRS